MSQYSTGTASVTNGSPTVTGTNTLWLANVTAGDSFTIASTGVMYDVASVDSDTQVTLSAPYAGTTASGVVYAIGTGFTVPDSFPEMSQGDIETATIFTRGMRKIQSKFTGIETNTTNEIGQAVNDHVALADPHSQYADQANTYTETEVDNLLDDKADKATTYTETEVDLLLDDKAAIAGQTFTGDIAAPKITASTGVLFGTDTAAANTLDDYEEGTWDIGLTIDGGQGSAKSGNLGCFYTKVGNSVTISGIVRKGSFASATGVVSFNGTLPFTAAYGFIIKCSTRALTGLEDGHIKAKDGTVALYSRVSNDNHDTPDTGNEVNTTDARTTKVIEFSAVYLTT